LEQLDKLPRSIAPAVASRLKVMADLDIAERRLPQDGRIRRRYQGKTFDLRVSTLPTRYGEKVCMRLLDSGATQLGLDKLITDPLALASIRDMGSKPFGMILVTGPTGSGKSTTLYSLLAERNDPGINISTVEDPIEYVFESKGCHVNQREVHKHTESFARALRGALREDPDVIMVGEMRDLETIQLALTAAETGHLVLGTLHTGNAPRTLDRILDVFPTDQRDQIRIMVSESLRGILSQQLVPKADGSGRALALELLVNTPAVANCIREGKTFMLPGVMQTGKNVGMITMDESLRKLYIQGVITRDECLFRAEDKIQMRAFFQS
jgi:twitching motility protein PilT